MSQQQTIAPTTSTLDVDGATLTYDIRDVAGGGAGSERASVDHAPLFLIGSPMDASGFLTLASHFGDRLVVTYDPRGTGRSTLDTSVDKNTPEQHAGDLARVWEAVGAGPVDVFASSGGAVNALAWVTAHPEQVGVLVAHEPPLRQVLPDSALLTAAVEDVAATYQRFGTGLAMAKFIALTSHEGELTEAFADQPAPDPAMFGMSGEDDGRRGDPLLQLNIRSCTGYQPDFDALRSRRTRIVAAVGDDSGQQMAARAGRAVAAALGAEPVSFPGGHAGFLGGEYGQVGEPDAFAARLRGVLGG